MECEVLSQRTLNSNISYFLLLRVMEEQYVRSHSLCRPSGFTSLMAGNQRSGVKRPLGDFRCSKNEQTGHEMRLSRSFLQANLDC